MRLSEILDLSPHGVDTFVGTGPRYPWGGLFGGQIVAQALRAAASTVDEQFSVHSLRAYFIRRGDHDEPVRYEVDRIRNGRSFVTRRVVARQAVGAILNLEASFQQVEPSPDIDIISAPKLRTPPNALPEDSWSPVFARAIVPAEELTETPSRMGAGRVAAWMKVSETLTDPIDQAAGLAYLSDDLPTDAVVRAHPIGQLPERQRWESMFSASLDHAIWFHRPPTVDAWHLHEFCCLQFNGGRGLAEGHVFDADGLHIATVMQEVLLRTTAASVGAG